METKSRGCCIICDKGNEDQVHPSSYTFIHIDKRKKLLM